MQVAQINRISLLKKKLYNFVLIVGRYLLLYVIDSYDCYLLIHESHMYCDK